MSYAAQSQTVRPSALIGAIGMPVAFGALLVAGLAITGTVPDPEEGFAGFFIEPVIPDDPLPPPPPKVEPKVEQDAQQITPPTTNSTITAPDSPLDLGLSDAPLVDLSGVDFTVPVTGTELAPITVPPPAPPTPLVQPVKAAPRGNPGRWVTDSDYRSRWIREDMSGTARFSLDIDARGRVSDCRITASTGHDALDTATCRLLERRARFTPARDGNGLPVASTYTNSISWQLPE